jgi:hypothetical protein
LQLLIYFVTTNNALNRVLYTFTLFSTEDIISNERLEHYKNGSGLALPLWHTCMVLYINYASRSTCVASLETDLSQVAECSRYVVNEAAQDNCAAYIQ